MAEVWTTTQMLDTSFRDHLASQPDNLHGTVVLEFTDGRIEVSQRVALLNLFFLQIPAAFGLPLCKHHFIKNMPFNTDSVVHAWNTYYHEVMDLDPGNAKKLKLSIWQVWQDLYQWMSLELLPWAGTLDIMDLSDIVLDPKMKEVIDTREKIDPKWGTDVIETFIDDKNQKIMKLLGTKDALQNDALYGYQTIRQLNKFQVPQTLYAFGVRTDVSDNIVGLPVIGSAVSGLRNIAEYAVESLSAKKSAFYNNSAIKESQYFGRKQHLVVSSIQHIYTHDCGNPVPITFRVTAQNYKNLIGKLVYKNDQAFHLTQDNVGSYVGEEIVMRSPMTCRFRKGVCTVCGGLIFNNINRKLGIGIMSATRVVEPTTQKILSAKHLIKTLSLIYELSKKASEILFKSNVHEIRWKPTIYNKLKSWKLGIPQKYFKNIHDVTLIRQSSEKPVKEERFSEIHFFVLRDSKGRHVIYDMEQGNQVPFFSAEMLFHIQQHYNELEIDEDLIWIPIEGTERFPIFRTVVINDNMLDFVAQVSGFLSKDIARHTTCRGALQAFSDIIHSKVDANIVHLETLLKAYEITSEYDFRVPLVTDPNHVKFETINGVLSNRHVGTKLAYQGLNQYMCQPSTYLMQHQPSPFDPMSIGM